MIFPISCKGPNTKKEKICMVTISPGCNCPRNTSHINMNRMICRSVFTNVPWTKLMLRILFTLVSSSPSILNVFLLRRFTSCCVSPKLFTSSIFRNDSVVAPAREVVCETIFFCIVFTFLLSRFDINVSRKIPPK